ncbi:MAG TPA: IPT/TIG domain-containing protein [Candidatus Kryptonia bacterium]|nr:IPT/TIG domain-containing protein [Candidatus Kryptonia bacterium]
MLLLVLASLLARAATAQGVSARGDANCSNTISAADFIATARGLGGASVCGNEDCDRNGQVDFTDVTCTANCLFSVCPIPASAPQITGVQPGSAPAIVPLSAIDIAGTNFGSPDHLTRATIGGLEAEVVAVGSAAAADSESLEVVVPAALPPGQADLVVFDRDVAGPAMPITISPAMPIGQPDTFDGTMMLVDTAVAKLAALDLDTAFGDTAAPLRDSLQNFRQQLNDLMVQLAANPDFTDAGRAQLDAAFDASGLPEMVRQLISDIDAAVGGQGGAADPTAVVGVLVRGAQTIRVVQGVVAAAGTGIAIPVAPILAGISLIAGVATGVIVAAVAISSGSTGDPFIQNVTFDPPGPHVGSVVTVTGQRLGSRVSLRILTQGPNPIVVSPLTTNAFQLTYQLPNDLCGQCEFQVGTDANPRLYTLRSGFVPELKSLAPASQKAGGRVVADTLGVGACMGSASFFVDSSSAVSEFAVDLNPIEGQHNLFDFLIPGTIRPRSYVGRARTYQLGYDDVPLEVLLALTGLRVACNPTDLDIPGTASCDAKPLPLEAMFPTGGTFTWSSSAPDVASVTEAGSSATVTSNSPGQATISATFTIGNSQFTSQNQVTLNVQDRMPPTVTITSESAAQKVRPGGLIVVDAHATDNVGVHRIVLHATGDAEEGDQEFDCGGQQECSTSFGVHAKTMNLQSRQIVLRADAFDVPPAGLEGSSNQLTFPISTDDACPVVAIQSPAEGATVKAGDSVQVSVRVTDNQPDDTGVRKIRINATGDAVASPPLPMETTLPLPLPQVTRVAVFTVKSAADLASIANRNIVLSASATDDVDNSCEPMTVTVTAGGPPVISSVPATVSVGASMTILGSGFGETQGASTVTVGGKSASVISWSNVQIVVTVPNDLSGNNIPVIVTVDGIASNTATTSVLGTGDVQVTLNWSDINDLDLHVIDPNGEEIYYGNRMSSSGGTLDVDANAACNNETTSPRENIFWPTGTAPVGTYTVIVAYYRGCGDPPGPSAGITVTARVDGRFMTLIDNATLASGTLQATFTR